MRKLTDKLISKIFKDDVNCLCLLLLAYPWILIKIRYIGTTLRNWKSDQLSPTMWSLKCQRNCKNQPVINMVWRRSSNCGIAQPLRIQDSRVIDSIVACLVKCPHWYHCVNELLHYETRITRHPDSTDGKQPKNLQTNLPRDLLYQIVKTEMKSQ